MRRAITILLVFAVAFTMGAITTSAKTSGNQMESSTPEDNSVRWTFVNSIILDIHYSGTTATCTSMIIGTVDVNRIVATFTLHRVNANGTSTLVRTFPTVTANGRVLTFDGTYSPVSRGQTYRMEVVATVTSTSGRQETVRDSVTRTYN